MSDYIVRAQCQVTHFLAVDRVRETYFIMVNALTFVLRFLGATASRAALKLLEQAIDYDWHSF